MMQSEQAFRRLVSLMDQIALALMNFAGLALFARRLSVEEFGLVAITLAILHFFEITQRGGIILPMISAIPHADDSPLACGAWFLLNMFVAFGVAFCLLLMGIGLKFFSVEFSLVFISSAVIVPIYMIYFFLRRMLYHQEKYRQALLMMLTFVVISTVVLLGSSLLYKKMTLWYCMMCIAVPHVIASCLMLYLMKSTFRLERGFFSFLVSHLRAIFELGGGGLAAYLNNNGSQLLLAVISGPVQAGIFAATRIFARPLLVMITSINDTERSKAAKTYAEEGEIALYQFIWSISLYLFFLLSPFLILLFIYTPELLDVFLGEKYSGYIWETRLWIVALIPVMLSLPFDILYTTQGYNRFLLNTKIIAAMINFTLLFCFILFDNLTVVTGILSLLLSRMYIVFISTFFCLKKTQS